MTTNADNQQPDEGQVLKGDDMNVRIPPGQPDEQGLCCDNCHVAANEDDKKCWNCGGTTFVYEPHNRKEPTATERPDERATFARLSSDYDGPREYYADTGEEVPIKFVEPAPYKPEYDFETKSIKHWWFRNESTLFRDIHTRVSTFRSRTSFGKYWKCLRIWLFDKYIGRHL